MRRGLGILVALVALAAAATVIYTGVLREREYRRLIADGDRARTQDQSFLAVEAYSGAIALKGDSMLGYLRRGETYRRRGDLEAALRDLREAARLDPTATRPLEQLGDVLYEEGRYGIAATRYTEFVRLDNRNPRVLYKLGLSRYQDGDVAAAIPPLRQAVALDGRFEEAVYLLGLCLHEQRRLEEALDVLRQAVALGPGSIEAREALSSLYAELGRTGEEIEQLEALAALNPDRPDRLVSLGLAYARANRTDLAVLTLGRAVERFPEQRQVYLALARLWLDLAEARRDRVALGKALEALQHVLGGPSSSEALMLHGRALLLAGDTRIAARVLQQAAAQRPVDTQALWYLAEAAAEIGDPAGAREALTRYDLLAGPHTPPARRAGYLARLGELSLQLDTPAAAASWFSKAIDADTPTADLLGRLAEARWRAGDLEAAREVLARAQEQAPGDPALRALQRRIESTR